MEADMWQQILEFLGSPAVLGWLAMATVWIWFAVTAKKPKWAKFGDIWYGAFNAAEKLIPDDTENKALHKLDTFLMIACKAYKERTGKTAPEAFKAHARDQAERLVYRANLVRPRETLLAVPSGPDGESNK